MGDKIGVRVADIGCVWGGGRKGREGVGMGG